MYANSQVHFVGLILLTWNILWYHI